MIPFIRSAWVKFSSFFWSKKMKCQWTHSPKFTGRGIIVLDCLNATLVFSSGFITVAVWNQARWAQNKRCFNVLYLAYSAKCICDTCIRPNGPNHCFLWMLHVFAFKTLWVHRTSPLMLVAYPIRTALWVTWSCCQSSALCEICGWRCHITTSGSLLLCLCWCSFFWGSVYLCHWR